MSSRKRKYDYRAGQGKGTDNVVLCMLSFCVSFTTVMVQGIPRTWAEGWKCLQNTVLSYLRCHRSRPFDVSGGKHCCD